MNVATTTRASLLIRLRDADDELAWSEFVEIYGPLVYRYGARHGLQDADATDLVQEVLRQVAGSIGNFVYDPQLGKFRGWLLTITRRALGRLRRQQIRQPAGSGDSRVMAVLKDLPAEEETAFWDEQYRQQIFQWAAEQVCGQFQDSTWQAFWLTAVEGQKPQQAADALGMSVGSVYVARNRVLKRLKEKIRQIDEFESV